MTNFDFSALFASLTGHTPMRWQTRLYESFLRDEIPQTINLPTGMGKTSVIHVWLLALAHQALQGRVRLARRLVYIVNRRTVVDQATNEVEKLAQRLELPELAELRALLSSISAFGEDCPLVVSTLRGQLADNATWRMDPARPAVVVGTVDMIGSRMLFSGYGLGMRSRPLHAGLLGQDALVVHDESHLEPAFQALLRSIESTQRADVDPWKFRVMALSATLRDGETGFSLDGDDLMEVIVRQRMYAVKSLSFHPVPKDADFPEKAIELALGHRDSGKEVIVFAQRVDHVLKIQEGLVKADCQVCVLTGTMRGLERDRLATENPVFASFLPGAEKLTTTETHYLICTSAGEVGVNLSADHMVCDLSCFDSMAQRLGRVNRFGTCEALVQVVTWESPEGKESTQEQAETEESPPTAETEDSTAQADTEESTKPAKTKEIPLAPERKKTYAILKSLPCINGVYDASPAALAGLDANEKSAAFTPSPEILPATDILFDAWSCTTLGSVLPGAVPVVEYLHGVMEWEPPAMRVAWRDEVEPGLLPLPSSSKQALFEDFPVKAHETLRDTCTRICRQLKEIVKRVPDATGWWFPATGEGRFDIPLAELIKDERILRESTLLLPPSVGGLSASGLLNGKCGHQAEILYDVSCEHHLRFRFWDDHEPPPGCRRVYVIDTRPEEDEVSDEVSPAARRFWHWYVQSGVADDDGSRTTIRRIALDDHGQAARSAAEKLARQLGFNADLSEALSWAAAWHDLGKHRSLWQRSIGNLQFPEQVLAKSDNRMKPQDLGNYRHELGSLLDIQKRPEFRSLAREMQELVLHLVGAHHGRCRPVFRDDEGYDPDYSISVVDATLSEVPKRYARLQRKFGRWGLAYLESMVRAIDIHVSMHPAENSDGGTK